MKQYIAVLRIQVGAVEECIRVPALGDSYGEAKSWLYYQLLVMRADHLQHGGRTGIFQICDLDEGRV